MNLVCAKQQRLMFVVKKKRDVQKQNFFMVVSCVVKKGDKHDVCKKR